MRDLLDNILVKFNNSLGAVLHLLPLPCLDLAVEDLPSVSTDLHTVSSTDMVSWSLSAIVWHCVMKLCSSHHSPVHWSGMKSSSRCIGTLKVGLIEMFEL
jgi:hypothetical protein